MRSRLIKLNMLVLGLVVVAMALVLRFVVEFNLKAALDQDMATRTRVALHRWYALPSTERSVLLLAFRSHGLQTESGSLADIFAIGSFSLESGSTPYYRPRLLTTTGRNYLTLLRTQPWSVNAYNLSLTGRDAYATVRVGTDSVRVYSIPIMARDRVDGVIQVAQSLRGVRHTVRVLASTLLALIPLALLAVYFGSAFLTDRAMTPVGRMARAADEISAGDLSRRIPVSGDDEFTRLGQTVNGMLGRLEDSFAQLETAYRRQQKFTGDASHELRTPLTVIKANTSLALGADRSNEEYRDALVAADRAADTMNAIVQDLLLLARADAGRLEMEQKPVGVGELLCAAVDAVPDGGIPVLVDAPPPGLVVMGDRQSLLRVLVNLLTNALRHTPATGSVRLSATAAAGFVELRVVDLGDGIAPEHLPHVKERFYRCDSGRSSGSGGSGLGLTICDSIVTAHGGTLSIESMVGVGTSVTVRLPEPEKNS